MERKHKELNRYNEERWITNYELASQFFQTKGHYPTLKENRHLYQWAMQWWRNTYLTAPQDNKEKAGKLNNIGFIYKNGRDFYEQLWYRNFEEAKAFFNEHGHFPTFTENRKLRSWVRSWWKIGSTKHPDKVKLLAEIGYTYQTVENYSEKLWHECYSKAKTFYDKNGRFPKKGEAGSLRNWATRWWRKSASDCPDKALLLMEIGFSYKSVSDVYENKWIFHYQGAKAFFDKNGHFPNYKENTVLYIWAHNWWKQNYLILLEKNMEKAQLLQSIGFNFKQSDHE